MREAVIVSTARTPIGKAFRGAFNDTQAQALGGHAITAAVERAGVDPAEVDGCTYLVAPRGETQWVRNLRAAGGGRLRVGRRVSAFTAVELDDADKLAVLRPYLRRWKWEVGQLFDGVGPDSSDAELLAVAPRHPVFAVIVV